MLDVAASPTLDDLKGLWTRSLIVWPDGSRDTRIKVWWLQGPGLYADLRQPPVAPGVDGARCLAHVKPAQLEWMSRQEAFAGELTFDGASFEWQRGIDLQPAGIRPDRGRLWFEEDVLIERGVHVDYVEHWHRQSGSLLPCAAALLSSDDGRLAYLVRVGTRFMYARGRQEALPSGSTLVECVRQAHSHEAACRFLDFEVALGRIGAAGWRIERSSLPFRCGQRFKLRATRGHRLVVSDTDFHAGTLERSMSIDDLRGSQADLLVGFEPSLQSSGT